MLWVSPGNLNHSFSHMPFSSAWPWPHPLISKGSVVRSFRPDSAPPDWRLPKMSEWSPYKAKRVFSRPICAKKQNNGPPGIDQGFSTASCNSRHAMVPSRWHPPTSSRPTLSASAEPISSKRIAPTDNMQPSWMRTIVFISMLKGLKSLDEGWFTGGRSCNKTSVGMLM